jgi:mycofactocin system FadH/OYE family oxidoreductase 2
MTRSRRYPLLFSPANLGPVRVENRIVLTAHLTNFAQDGLPTDQHAAYYEARADGGAGLVITEENSVHPTDCAHEKVIRGFSPEVIPAYRKITDSVHRHGTPIFAQVNHNGAHGDGTYSRLALWAASAVADPLSREVPKAVEEQEIAEVITAYATVATHCARGGFDGIEVQCSGSSIVCGFLSPMTNLRTDAYGGSLERRARLVLEILSAVRDAVGRDLAIGVRLCGDERIDRGTTITDALAVAQMVEAQGCADYLNTAVGATTAKSHVFDRLKHVPSGYSGLISAAFRGAVSLPVVAAGRYREPAQAERALRAGHCDLVGVVRAQIADPQFAYKALSGHTEAIHICASCTHDCVVRVRRNCSLRCTENPQAGREADSAPREVSASGSAQRVVVVGAGPAGLQAAIAAARGGHEVIVFEKDSEVGGRLRLAATAPGRGELRDLVRSQLAQCLELGVEIRLSIDATPAAVLGERPAVVIVATGSRPRRPKWACDAPPPLAAARRCHRCARRLGPAVGRGAGHRRARVPSGHERRRASGRPGMCGRDHHAGHGRRSRSRAQRGSRSLQRARSGETDSPVDRSCARSPRSGRGPTAPPSHRDHRAATGRLGGARSATRDRGPPVSQAARRGASARCETCRRLHGAAPCPFGGHRGRTCRVEHLSAPEARYGLRQIRHGQDVSRRPREGRRGSPARRG